ncbi:enediyne biosynthesis protein [Streptomyces sp. AK010]|uniref:enediyne biosynthesis protein n=1 Tax=Streptomyces sp. AK010 TaxID=2723074 RepID=UPI0017B4B95B|nr:enediyne biosynthesis protein [Streptomyces sp. AK010]MBB6420831.1 hypothetical protein [Streptomyces sp. AK010]
MTEAPTTPPRHDPKIVTALRRFAISITVLNVAGYTVLGFEQPWLWPFIAVAVGYCVETVLEFIGARVENRRPRFAGGGAKRVMEFLYPSHITALAVNMLLYVNDRLWVMVLGVVIAVSAKWVLRAPVRGKPRHFMNPSNFGIAVVLLLFPWASIAPPYQFTEYTDGAVDWIIPAVIVTLGTLLNAKLTGRMWLIGGWLVVFVLQAVLRGVLFDTAIPPALGMMTGVAFVLFTNYMVTDPGTTPSRPVAQVAFGGGVAATYGIMTGLGIAYGLFFATAVVCLVRGGYLWLVYLRTEPSGTKPAPESAIEARGVSSGAAGKAPVAA